MFKQKSLDYMQKIIERTVASFPTWCFACKKHIDIKTNSPCSFLCVSCYRNLPFSEKVLCGKCGLKHDTSNCHSKWSKNISKFDAIFEFKEPVSKWITHLKYFNNLYSGRVLQELVTIWLKQHEDTIQPYDIVVPVPLHAKRLFWRMFNQSYFLIKKQTYLPVVTNGVVRVINTPHQTTLHRSDRQENLKNAFVASESLIGKSVLIFDDVCTTGATIEDLSYALKKGGVNQIGALTLTRVL